MRRSDATAGGERAGRPAGATRAGLATPAAGVRGIKINGAKKSFFNIKHVSQKLTDFANEEGFEIERLEYNFVDSEKMFSLNKDSGIEQTWNFAHPDNKKITGPLPNFKMMIKGKSYQMLLNHLSHTITKVGGSDKWAQFEVIILDKDKIYHKFNWQVEKYTADGPLKDCWLTTMVSSPIALGSSI